MVLAAAYGCASVEPAADKSPAELREEARELAELKAKRIRAAFAKKGPSSEEGFTFEGSVKPSAYTTERKRALRQFRAGLELMYSNPEDAVKQFNLALMNAPGLIEARYNLALTYYLLDDMTGARTELLKAIKAGIKSTDVYNALGKTYFGEGNLKEAAKAFSYANSIEEQPSTLVNNALIYQVKGMRDKAMDYYKRASVLDPDNPYVDFNTGVLMLETGNYEEALERLSRTEKLWQTHPRAFSTYVKALCANGKVDEAIGLYLELVEQRPELVYLYKDIAILYELYKRNTEKALSYYKKYVSLGGEDSEEVRLWMELIEKGR